MIFSVMLTAALLTAKPQPVLFKVIIRESVALVIYKDEQVRTHGSVTTSLENGKTYITASSP